MKSRFPIVWVCAFLFLLLFMIGIFSYNRLMEQEEAVSCAWAQVENKRRYHSTREEHPLSCRRQAV